MTRRRGQCGSSRLSCCIGLGIFGRIGQYPLRWSDAFSEGGDYQANLSLNPFQSFFSSLKFRHSTYDEAKVKAAYPVLAPYFGWDSGYDRAHMRGRRGRSRM